LRPASTFAPSALKPLGASFTFEKWSASACMSSRDSVTATGDISSFWRRPALKS